MNKEIVSFDEWQKLDLRIGKILEISEIKGADKLYKLKIDLGKEIGERILLAGLKPYFEKEELKSKKIVVFVNLQPRKIMGIESQGMLLAADEEGKPILITPEKNVKIGSKIR